MKRTTLLCKLLIASTVILASCKSATDQFPIDSNFPLKQAAKFSYEEPIERIAVSDTWIAIQTADELIGVDANLQETLWSIPFDVWYTTGSKFQIINDSLIAASNSQVALINRDGQLTTINIDSPEEGSVWRLVAVYPNFIYIIRGPDWTLEAYDIAKNSLLWKTIVGRGGADVFYDSTSGTTYITSRDYSVRAIENATGAVVWTQDKRVLHSTFDDNVLFLCELTDEEDVYRTSALDVITQTVLWTKDISQVDSIYRMTLVGDFLAISTGEGLIAINKSNGNHLWHSLENEAFITSPVESNGHVFIKGTSRTVYALSPANGNLVGYLITESKNNLIEPAYEAEGEIHLLDKGIVLNTRNALIVYDNK